MIETKDYTAKPKKKKKKYDEKHISEVQEYLSQYILLKQEIKIYRDEYKKTFDSVNKLTSSYSGIPGENVTSKPPDKWVEMITYRDDILEYLSNLFKINRIKLNQIIRVIDTLTDTQEKLILKLRYISGLKFSEIPKLVGVTERTMYNIHKEALSKIKLKK